MKNHPFCVFLVLLILLSCRSGDDQLSKLDLTPYGIPVTILAPDSAEVVHKDYSAMRDITIRKGDEYYVQIFEFEAPRIDAAGEKLRQLQLVREDPFFSEIIYEDDYGFIYSTQPDSNLIDFDFRYIRLSGTKELIFQTGLVGTFSQKDVERMYNAVK